MRVGSSASSTLPIARENNAGLFQILQRQAVRRVAMTIDAAGSGYALPLVPGFFRVNNRTNCMINYIV